MLIGQIGSGSLGFNPFKSVAHGIERGAKATGRGIKKGAKATGHVVKKYGGTAVMIAVPVVGITKIIGSRALKLALKPVKSRVNVLKDRRARKLAMDRRKSTTPNAAEREEARKWAKAKLKGQIPFGPILSSLAGSSPLFGTPDPEVEFYGAESVEQFGEVITAATILASIPVMLAIVNHFISGASKGGEAPATPQEAAADAQAEAGAAAEAAAAQAEAAAAGGAPEESTDTAADGGGGGGLIPHGGKLKQSHLLLGGALLAGIILVVALSGKKKS